MPFPLFRTENGSEQKSFLNLVQRQKEDIIHICSKYDVGSKSLLDELTQPLICSQFWKVPHISAEATQASLLFWLTAFFLTLGLLEHSRLDMGNYKGGCALLQILIIFQAILLAAMIPYDQHILHKKHK